MRMQHRQPLAVLHVGLAPREVSAMSPIDHYHLNAGLLHRPIKINPVNSRRFHRHRAHALCLKIFAELFHLFGDTEEHLGLLAGHRNEELFAAHINASGVGIKNREV